MIASNYKNLHGIAEIDERPSNTTRTAAPYTNEETRTVQHLLFCSRKQLPRKVMHAPIELCEDRSTDHGIRSVACSYR